MIDRTASLALQCTIFRRQHMTHNYKFLAPWVPLFVDINWAALLTPLVLVQL